MLYLLDSNILLYAKMDAMPEHEVVSKWVVDTVSDPCSSVMVCETTILSFLRISTNPKIFDPPLPAREARDFLRSFLDHPNVSVSSPLSVHFIEVTELMEKHNFTANLTMDAHLAVLAMTTGAILVTRDRDFHAVPFLKTLNPLGK